MGFTEKNDEQPPAKDPSFRSSFIAWHRNRSMEALFAYTAAASMSAAAIAGISREQSCRGLSYAMHVCDNLAQHEKERQVHGAGDCMRIDVRLLSSEALSSTFDGASLIFAGLPLNVYVTLALPVVVLSGFLAPPPESTSSSNGGMPAPALADEQSADGSGAAGAAEVPGSAPVPVAAGGILAVFLQ